MITEEYVQPAMFTKFTELIIKLIGELSRPSFFSEEISSEYFNLLTRVI